MNRLLKALKVVAEGPKTKNFKIDRIIIEATPERADITVTVTIDYEGLKKHFKKKYDDEITDVENWVDDLGPSDFHFIKGSDEVTPPKYFRDDDLNAMVVFEVTFGGWEYSGGEVQPIDQEEWYYGTLTN